jgi:hypothetical protein
MSSRRRVSIVVVVLLAGFVLVLALRNRQAPLLPSDEDHAEFLSGEQCQACHGPGEPVAQSQNHPIGTDCMRCHSR